MKILVTGAQGFIGKNLIARLNELKLFTVFSFDKQKTIAELDLFTRECDFIFHLAGINRPKEEREYLEGNYGFTTILLDLLKKHGNISPILLSSSIQAKLNNPYGISKKACEDLLFKYSEETGAKVIIYRFENVFGKWARPNYNSVIATFSHNIANDIPISISNPNVNMSLIYIDDLVTELINALNGKPNMTGKFAYVKPVYNVNLGYVAELLGFFKKENNTLSINEFDDLFIKKLYLTYVSYLPQQ